MFFLIKLFLSLYLSLNFLVINLEQFIIDIKISWDIVKFNFKYPIYRL